MGSVISEDIDSHNQSYSAEFVLPPLSITVFRPEKLLSVQEISEEITEESAGSRAESTDAQIPPTGMS
jgi:hypothetical protein